MVIGMNNVVITIARQYGSGGRTIGEMLAKKLNVHYYDKELMKLASDDSGINEALFVNADEKVKNTSLFHIARKEYHGELIPPDTMISHLQITCLTIRRRSSVTWQRRNPASLSVVVRIMC